VRSIEEIKVELDSAMSINDSTVTQSLVKELRAIGTPQADALVLRSMGVMHLRTGDHFQAVDYFRQALDVNETLGDRAAAAVVTGNLGMVYRSMGEFPKALEHYRRSLEVQEELGNRSGTARVLLGMGNVFFQTGDYPQALQHYHRALHLQEDLGDLLGAAHTVGNIGIVYMATGDYPQALEHYHRALHMHEEGGDRIGAANVLSNIGVAYLNTGDYSRAMEHLQRGLQLHEEQGNRAGIATVTSSLGNVYHRTGDTEKALEYLQSSLLMHEQAQNKAGAAIVTGNMATVLLEMNRDEEAAALLQKQSSMALDQPASRAEFHANKARLAEKAADLDEAWAQLHKAFGVVTETGERDLIAECHEKLRDLAKQRKDFEGYVEHNEAFLRIAEEVRGVDSTRRMAMLEAERHIEGERREHAKERALLYGALPEHVATRMLRGERIEDHYEHATVLFSDIVGFTNHTSSLTPGAVISLLEELYRRFDSICAEHGVTKVKTIGDSYLCFKGDEGGFGNALAVAQVALAFQRAEFMWPSGEPLTLRIGIHSGPVSAGVIGTERMQYDIWGDTVNVASRMESTSEPGRIHVSESFAQALKGLGGTGRDWEGLGGTGRDWKGLGGTGGDLEAGTWNLELRGATEVKGKGTMTTYWLE
jgi:adenylate cyclase